ncbi:single myb histone 4-like [Rosa chinensis]|uniref:single myb histone 4-like n=1 Tax=Rosa chinensis TaxID=74649 RepID=UPI000D08B5AD|nr:single myb histone 4-like [Rosa chinensis]
MEGECQEPQKWTAEEEEALLAGVAKHGVGKWKIILEDSEFGPILTHRSNHKLRYKWRRWSVRPSGNSPFMADVAAKEAQIVSDTEEEQRVSEMKEIQGVSETKEMQRISKSAEDTESMLQLANEIYERCSRG